MIATPYPKTKKNTRLLKLVKRAVDCIERLSAAEKLGLKFCIDITIHDVHERCIETFCDLIDYLKVKAQEDVTQNSFLSPDGKNYANIIIDLLAEVTKKACKRRKIIRNIRIFIRMRGYNVRSSA